MRFEYKMNEFKNTLDKIGFSSQYIVGSTLWLIEANNFYADWANNASDDEFERVYPSPKFVKFESIVEITGDEFDELERRYGYA